MSAQDRLPSLSVLRCFEASAKHQSFTAAAEDLGLTQSAVSRQVKELETHVGTPLFRREGRGVRLTDAGRALFQPLLGDLERLRRTVHHAVAAGAGAQLLAIAAPPTFAARWLVPKLSDFRDLHPGLELVVSSRPEPFDLHEERVDVAVHFGGWDWPGAQLTPLCPEKLVVVAAPALLARYPVARPVDILEMPLLHLSSRPDQWDHFGLSIAQGRVPRSGSHFDQFGLVIGAATAGMGAAILPTYLIEQELSDGRLTHLADADIETSKSYFVATPLGQSKPLASAFTAWLRKQVVRRR
ncbi:MAG: LysR family transcriptional regulator [Rhodobacter sp.]|nr:LysR family transcriptional regulator [Rhodobacter sp.]